MQLHATSARPLLALAFTLVTAATPLGCGSKGSGEPAPSASAVATLDAPTESASAEAEAPPSTSASARYGVTGPAPDDSAAREAARLKDAADFGMIGLLNTGAGGDPKAPTAPWGRDDSTVIEDRSARGNMWGDAIGDAFGAGGLGLSGIGEGGGGRNEGIGLGSIGGLGHGAGVGSGTGLGSGRGRGPGTGGGASASNVSVSSTVVSGSLPQEVVQRIVRSHLSALRRCYDGAVTTDPTLTGVVAIEFTIDASGKPINVKNPGTPTTAGACMTQAFTGMSFPAPENGPCTVTATVALPPRSEGAKVARDATPSPVADPSTSVEQIHGRALDAVQAGDVAEAMRAAGCTDVEVGAKDGVTVITAKYKDANVTITFAAAGSSAVVPAEEAKRLRGSAVVVERLGMFLAIEGPRAIADSLRRAIVVYGPVK